MKEYYMIINKQGFVNAKEEPRALKIWTSVLIDNISIIMHTYKDYELLELLLFNLPWFQPNTSHADHFSCYMRLCKSIFPHDSNFIPKVVKHVFSPNGLFKYVFLRLIAL
jgi:hypothetical protein